MKHDAESLAQQVTDMTFAANVTHHETYGFVREHFGTTWADKMDDKLRRIGRVAQHPALAGRIEKESLGYALREMVKAKAVFNDLTHYRMSLSAEDAADTHLVGQIGARLTALTELIKEHRRALGLALHGCTMVARGQSPASTDDPSRPVWNPPPRGAIASKKAWAGARELFKQVDRELHA